MPAERARRELTRMVAAVRHESFYVTGTWVDEAMGVYVGWAVQKDSFSDGMPVRNERGDIVLVFAGEEFPEPGTRRRLQERGHAVEAEGSSYLVHLCEEEPDFPAGLNGRFHGVVVDRARGTATLFNDRYGMHRIYGHEAKEGFYFAVEAKAILAVRPELRSADHRAIGEFIACGCVLENRTLFEGIKVLPPASAWILRNGLVERRNSYFQPRQWEEQAPLEPESYYRELRDVFSRKLSGYFNGGQRVGIALTGGLDTRAIMAWRNPPPDSLPCYTFGGTVRDSQDVLIARRVASVCRQPYEVITVGDEFLSRFPHYAERTVYLTEGCVEVSKSPDLYVSERARQIAPVKIVGTFGSEIIGQALMFKPGHPVPGLFRPEVLSYVDQAQDTYAQILLEHPVTFAAVRQPQWHHHGIFGLEQTQLSVRTPFLDNDFVQAVYRAPRLNDSGDIRLRMIGEGNPALSRIRSDRGVGGRYRGLAGAASRSFLEFTVKAEYAYDYGMPQWVARIDHLLSPFRFERLFLGRHKFAHFRTWYQTSLSEYVRQVLLDPVTLSRPYLRRTAVEDVVQGHLKGNRNYTTTIHKLLTLELLHRLFLDPR
jgi:asparagine synthase (glutamine-hydrolysing)